MEACEDQNAILPEVSNNFSNDESPSDSSDLPKETKDHLPPLPNIDKVEAILKYEFKNKCLLEEVFTYTSYPNDKWFSFKWLEYVEHQRI